jgi:putative transposase
LLKVIDEEYTAHPYYGSRRMAAWLGRKGYCVNRKRVIRLYEILGLEAVYPKPRTSLLGQQSKKYPYLLRGMSIDRRDQVWSADITYIRLTTGFVYLVAIVDWRSRYILAWRVSTTMELEFCLDALDEALKAGKCEIFNTDQGVQFTAEQFTERLIRDGVKISWDSRGRALDNVFIERVWRSLKYEKIYLMELTTVPEAKEVIGEWFQFYNEGRPHQALGYKTPGEVYRGE